MKKLTYRFTDEYLSFLIDVATAKFETKFPENSKDYILPLIFADVLHISQGLRRNKFFSNSFDYLNFICGGTSDDDIPGLFEAMTIKFLYDNEKKTVRNAAKDALVFISEHYDFDRIIHKAKIEKLLTELFT